MQYQHAIHPSHTPCQSRTDWDWEVHPSSAHRLFLTSTMPVSLCLVQYMPFDVPGTLKVGREVHPSSAHRLCATSTMPVSLFLLQYMPFDASSTLKAGVFEHIPNSHFLVSAFIS